jgi:competence protein ComEC
VLGRYQVGRVLHAGPGHDSPLYDEWLRLISEQKIQMTVARAGQQIDLGDGVIIRVLNPPPEPFSSTEADIDNNGAVLRLSAGEVGFLLSADIRREAEFELIARRADLDSAVLQVAHHGSASSTTQEFLAAVAPQLAVISVGTGNRYGHPSEEVIKRLEQNLGPENVYRTDEHGTIEFITDGKRLWMKVAR